MTTYTLDLNRSYKPARSGHLQMGGVNRLGERFGVTSEYLTHNDRPFFGLSGEFQFSRYPEAYWEEEILKIKAGGINIIATYFFWNHHEQQPGVFTWEGRFNARQFVSLCAKHGMWVIARIGPFAHGECRNGGLPDWLYGQPFEVRSNDPEYLSLVRRYYQQIAHQLSGLLFKDNGPVMCIQLENEYEHAGAPWDAADRSAPIQWLPRGSGGVEHMRNLKQIAESVGLTTPLYTVTGWGSPVIEDETLPVYGGYAYPVWIAEPGPSDLYLFYDRQSQPHPDSRHRLPDYYPLMNAEMQGGIQVRYNNRPVVPARSTEALALVQIGSGSSFLGYYVYHGGSNPFCLSGYTNEILHPQVSYDFQAVIGEYGEIRDACRYLKILHQFIAAFGETLAPMQPVFPQGSKEISLLDTRSLRYCARVKDGSGYLFLNNFQDHVQNEDISSIRFRLTLNQEEIILPHVNGLTLRANVCCIFPLNFMTADARLVYATAQPLTRIASIREDDAEEHFFFYAPEGIKPEYCFIEADLRDLQGDIGMTSLEGDKLYMHPEPGCGRSFSFTTPQGKRVRITTLTRWEAEHAWRGTAWDSERLVISSADIVFDQNELKANSVVQSKFSMTVFPPVHSVQVISEASFTSETQVEINQLSNASMIKIAAPSKALDIPVEHRSGGKVQLRFPADWIDGVSDVFIIVDYTGDLAGAYINGQLIADNYNNGTPWVIGLKRFTSTLKEHNLVLAFRPLRKGEIKNVSTAMAARMDFEGEERLEIHAISFTPEYTIRLTAS